MITTRLMFPSPTGRRGADLDGAEGGGRGGHRRSSAVARGGRRAVGSGGRPVGRPCTGASERAKFLNTRIEHGGPARVAAGPNGG